MAIDWSRVGAGIERAGARWSGSIMDELQARKAEERAMRMFKFKLGEETKARKVLMEEGNKIALDLERGKAALGSELQSYLGSPQLKAYLDIAAQPGQIGPQMQALGTRDLIGRMQRFERPTPEDAKLVQSLPLDVQAPIATAMGTVNKYYQKEDFEKARFEKQGAYYDAQIGHLQALTDTLRGRAGGAITPEQARKLLDSSTKGLVSLQGDDYFQILLRKTSRKEELKPEEKVAWQDFMLRYQLLHGSINAARQVLSGGILPSPTAIPEKEVVPPRPKGKFEKAFTEGWFPEEGWKGNVDRFVQDLITKGYVGVQEGSKDFMLWLKKLIQAIERGEWLEPISKKKVKNRKKGLGYFGQLQRPDNLVSTELSIGVTGPEFDWEETEIPLLVPSLTKDEIDFLLAGNEATPEIVEKAKQHALIRIRKGLSPFAQPGEQQYRK